MREPTEENRLGEAADVRTNQCVLQEEAQGGVSVSDHNETNKALRTINAETFNPKFPFFYSSTIYGQRQRLSSLNFFVFIILIKL